MGNHVTSTSLKSRPVLKVSSPSNICPVNDELSDCTSSLKNLQVAIVAGDINTIQKSISSWKAEGGSKLIRSNFLERNKHGRTSLHLSAKLGKAGILKLLLIECEGMSNKDIVDVRDINNYTPLHLASSRGHISCIAVLCECGADVNCRDNDYKTPLLMAASLNQSIAISHLIDWGADIYATDNLKKSNALHVAAVSGSEDSTAMLLKCVWANAWNNVNKNCIEENSRKLQNDGNKHINSSLIRQPESLYALNDIKRDFEIAALTVVSSFVNAREEPCGHTPLHRAALRGNDGIVCLLISLGAQTGFVTNPFNDTPLHLASEEGHLEVCRTLLYSGADPTARNHSGYTPAQVAPLNSPCRVLLNEAMDVKGGTKFSSSTAGRPWHQI